MTCPVTIDLSDFRRKVQTVIQYQLTGDPYGYDAKVELRSDTLPQPSDSMVVEIPPHGISFVEFKLK
jgi:hypothetical protein